VSALPKRRSYWHQIDILADADEVAIKLRDASQEWRCRTAFRPDPVMQLDDDQRRARKPWTALNTTPCGEF
jgi:hypothetical protein